ncbi:histidine phosphatase family protein [Paenibacillus farraposensis]|uniref:Histidine phosphatase family protein n=1 Tax=Paenibacillus farraposensis TaxID=2807095 RepID=A0ABW4DAE6_9BACL|nr:histidine phosphatase family protein [Paenibacillus farraposensis]MCC3380926.1 histidine phosphatase family protein [Paenibacillus farraposensis]
MLIGLIRHGLTDWNAVGKIQGHSDIPLNEEGRRQARLLAERLKREPYYWDGLITSSLSRAKETGEIIASALHLPLLEPDDRLRERAYGQVEGMTQAQREAKWGVDWHLLDLGQESDEDLQLRALAFMEAMWAENQDKHLLVVSHGGFLAHLYKALYREKYTERIGNLSLSILQREDADWIPLLYNCTNHLQEKSGCNSKR